MIEVKDGERILQFEGELLGASSSYKPGALRWIEFSLYKTRSGSYVLSRVGASLIFHTAGCFLTQRYNLNEVSVTDLRSDAVACYDCQPTRQVPYVFPEKYRHWAQVTENPEVVLDSLHKRDESGSRYLTKVAQRVLEQASESDADIDQVYRVEIIP